MAATAQQADQEVDAAAQSAARLRERLSRMRDADQRPKLAETVAAPPIPKPPVPEPPPAQAATRAARVARPDVAATRPEAPPPAPTPPPVAERVIAPDVEPGVEPANAPPAPQTEPAIVRRRVPPETTPRTPRTPRTPPPAKELATRPKIEPAFDAAPTGARAPHDLAADGAEPASSKLSLPEVSNLTGQSELRRALEGSKHALKAVGWFSCGINVLMLTGPIFMLQVYDRVISSGSYWTLTVLLAITTALYGVIGALEYIRSRVITRIGVEIDQRISNRVFEASVRKSLGGPGQATGALRELDTLRQFVAGPAPMTAFDLMWTPVYLLVIFFTHWTLGIASVVGMAALLFCAWLSDAQGKAPLAEAGKAAARGIDMAETGSRNADSITAMGMMTAYRARWQKLNQEALGWQVLASDRLGGTASFSKTLRLLMQSVMLAIGAALAMRGDISMGAIIAGTIIFGRALAPVEQVITHWKASAKALEAYKKLEQLLAAVPPRGNRTQLPRPTGHVVVEGLRVAAPETKTLILAGVTCDIRPGKMLAVIGPSASGKSTFIRALVGLWPAFAGTIKLDNVRLDHWHAEDLGRHVGYLPQDVELFGGTVRDNIARFRDDVPDDDVVAAAKAAHAHDLIMGLPKGYDTELGAFGAYLSAGQRQRIGLSRALFGNPALVVLDEPNANLDRAGDEALAAAIDGMRERGQAVVLVSHRIQAIGKADSLLLIERGVQRAFGPRDEVMRSLNGEAAAGAKPPAQQPAAPPAQKAPPKTAQAKG